MIGISTVCMCVCVCARKKERMGVENVATLVTLGIGPNAVVNVEVIEREGSRSDNPHTNVLLLIKYMVSMYMFSCHYN